MTADHTTRRRPALLTVAGAALLVLGAGAGWLAANWFPAVGGSFSRGDRRAIEGVVHDYILAHPEIIPAAMDTLQRREDARQLAGVRDAVETPYPGAVLGNPKGTVTLVEFTDYACGYCRRSVQDVQALLKSHPDLKIVVRELPILSEESGAAARMALAAAEQGKYAAFHNAMFASGPPSAASIEAVARSIGLDMAKARAAASSPRITAEVNGNVGFARKLGFSGTPSWVVGDQLISGAVGTDTLARAIVDSRS